jgi:U1 small nuclear ribonucleoprotein
MMFEPLAPLEFKPPLERRALPTYSGVSKYSSLFETGEPPKPRPFETPIERKAKAKERLQKQHKEKNELLVNEWDPHNNPKATE